MDRSDWVSHRDKQCKITHTVTVPLLLTNLYKIMSPKIIKRQECLVYSRVNGWYTPTTSWNKGKTSEWNDRKTYKVK